MAVTYLKNIYPNVLPEQTYYFYDGEVKVRFGVIEIPSENLTWLQRVWGDGYRVDPAGGKELSWDQTLAYNDSAKSAGDDIEGTDPRGQPAGEDRVRPSKLPRNASVPKARVASRGRPRTAKRTP